MEGLIRKQDFIGEIMRQGIYKKIVYDKENKNWMGEDGDFSEEMIEAVLYDVTLSDETILSFYDDDVLEFLEIWTIFITYETV